jgi:hypothetical protein
MGLTQNLYSSLRLTRYLNTTNQVLSTDTNGNLILISLSGTITTLTFTQADLVSMGGGFYKIPLTLTGSQSVLSVRIVYSTTSIQVVPQWENSFLINFDNNSTQTIYVKIG